MTRSLETAPVVRAALLGACCGLAVVAAAVAVVDHIVRRVRPL